jgi:agmatinase
VPIAWKPPQVPFLGAAAPPAGVVPSFAFFGAPHGTPYAGTDNRPYATAPDAVRAALAFESRSPDHHDFDLGGPVLDGRPLTVADIGDLPTSPDDGPANRALIEQATRDLLAAGSVPLMVGGDDSVPIPFLAAFAEHGPIWVVQVDAHIDWRDERFEERLGFSSTMRRASEMPHVAGIVQIGMRGVGSARPGEVADALAWGATLVPARDVHDRGVELALASVPAGSRVVLTVDCDAFDPGEVPAVAAPAPGGLTFRQATDLIADLAARARIVGADVIELVPGRDHAEVSATFAGLLLWHVVGRIARSSRAG